MAKIIIRANVANPSFLVSQKVISVPTNMLTTPSNVEVVITPVGKAVILAEDFSTGILNDEVNSILFTQSGSKIIANVGFNELKIGSEPLVINLPISGSIKQLTSSIKLIEISPINNKLITNASNYGSTSSRLIAEDSVVEHVISGDAGETVQVLMKSFMVPSGFKFTKLPSFKITGSSDGYVVKSIDTKDSKGIVIGKTFSVSYTFKDLIKSERVDTISFSYSMKEIKGLIVEAKNKKEEKIYSIDTGRDIGPEGGLKTIVVKGVPGSSFKISTKNSSNNGYNHKTGAFDGGSGFLEGVIPLARQGFGYGEFRANIRVAPSQSGGSVSTSISTNAVIDHKALAESVKDPSVRVDIVNTPSKKYEDTQLQNTTLTLSCKDGGVSDYNIATPLFIDSKPSDANVLKDHFFIKDFGALEKNGSYSYTGIKGGAIGTPKRQVESNKEISAGGTAPVVFIIQALADNKFIRVNRQPIILTNEKYFRASQSVNEVPLKDSVNGNKILMDAGNSVRHSVTSDTSDGTTIEFDQDMKVKATVKGIGERVEHNVVGTKDDGFAYKGVVVSFEMTGLTPATNINMDININNFLTIFSL
tara:strand:+ start:12730 stop:14496 length:1767 start_codon:yes stop_codon:yes gene_type:complete